MKMHSLCFGLALVAGVSALAEDTPATTPIAFLQEIKGDVLLLRGGGEEKLNPARARGMLLHRGETLRCSTGSSAEGFKADVSRTNQRAQDLCNLGEVARAAGDLSTASRAMEQIGRRAGRNKGEDVLIFAPPDHGAVLPGSLVVRWRTRPPLDIFTATLTDSKGAELAKVADVDGSVGSLDVDVLRGALIRYGQSSGDHIAKLTFHGKTEPDQSVTFHVLTPAQETELKRKLVEDTQQEGLFHYVERAAVFDSFQLYDEVAAEYDAALKEAPESRDLLQAAFNAYSRIGDFRTARSLRDRLEQVEDAEAPR